MRITTGSARGTRLKTPGDDSIRPTSDRVKQSIFNIIQFDIEGRRVLDLFAGSGQLGLETLSRGAASAALVDNSRDAAALVRENAARAGLSDRAEVVCSDYKAFLQAASRAGRRFDLILLDPPYREGYIARIIGFIDTFDILAEYGIIVCEGPSDDRMPDLIGRVAKGRVYRYGGTSITLYHPAERTADSENGSLPGQL